jgi:hypothetical protein
MCHLRAAPCPPLIVADVDTQSASYITNMARPYLKGPRNPTNHGKRKGDKTISTRFVRANYAALHSTYQSELLLRQASSQTF